MATQRAGAGATVLLVEARDGRRETIEAALAGGDELALRNATGVEDALAALDGDDGNVPEVDCVVVGGRLPDGDDVELVERLRAADKHLPIVCYPADGSGELASRALAAGATDYASPEDVDGDDLAARVREHVDAVRRRVDRQRHLEAIETAPEGISILDGDGRFRYVNRAYANLYGYQRSDLVGEHWRVLYPDGEAERVREEILPLVEETGRWRGETTGLRADGTTFVEDHVLARTASGGYICTVRDVTDRKERERELRDTTELLEAVVEASPAAIVAMDRDGDGGGHGDVQLWNPAAEEIFGWSEAAVLGEPLPYVPDEREAEHREYCDRIGRGETIDGVETKRERKDGELMDVNLSVAPIRDSDGELDGCMGAILDVTERKQRERELQRTRELLADAERLADVGAWEWEPATGEMTWTEGTRRLFEVSSDFVPTVETAKEFVHPDDLQRLRTQFEEYLEQGRFEPTTTRIITAEGRERWVRLRGERIVERDGADADSDEDRSGGDERPGAAARDLDAADASAYLEGVSTDIQRASGDLQGASVALQGASADLQGASADLQRASADLEGTSRERDGASSDVEPTLRESDSGDVRLGDGGGSRADGPHEAPDPESDGSVDDGDGRILVRGVVQDVTERRRRDQQVAVLDRVLRRNVRSDVDAIVDRARTIAEYGEGPAADSASAIVDRGHQLKVLANKHREIAKLLSEPRSLHEYDVAAMLERVADQMRETYPRAEVGLTLPRPVDVVATAEIEAAVAELVENAVVHSDADVPTVELEAEVGRDAVQVTVADDGPGLPEAQRDAIHSCDDVEPLEHDDGTGLWLARWIVSRAGGTVTVEDREPRGTEVRLRLPRTPVEPDLPRDDPGQAPDA